MVGPFVGDQWDDKEWYRSSRWDEEIATEFEVRLARARAFNRPSYLRIQGVHLIQQPDSTLREVGRGLLRRVIAEGADRSMDVNSAHEILADSFSAEGMLDEAVDAYRSTLVAITSAPNGRNMTSGLTELSFAEVLLRRRAQDDLDEARVLLDAIDPNGVNSIGLFKHVTVRYLMACAELNSALDQHEAAQEYLEAARETAVAPTIPTRPLTAAEPLGVAPSAALASIVAEIAPMMKAAGFLKRRHSFNRKVEDGLTHVLSFQAAPVDPPGPGDEESQVTALQGKFTVNLGVHVPGMRGIAPGSGWINEYNAHLRMRLGELADEAGRDVWWDVLHPDAGADVASVTRDFGLTWLARFTCAEDVVGQWRSEGYLALGMHPAAGLDIASLLVSRNDRSAAEAVLRDYIGEEHVPGHLAYVRRFLPTIGMEHLLPPETPA